MKHRTQRPQPGPNTTPSATSRLGSRSSSKTKAGTAAGLAGALLLSLTSAVGLAPATHAAAADAPSIVLHYDFDGDLSGGVVTDTSGSGLDGTLVNPSSAGQVTSVDSTQALSLPGGAPGATTAPYINIPNGLFNGLSATTISTWLKWSGGADFQWVYNLGKDPNTATFLTPSFAQDSKTRSSIKPVNGSAEVGVPGSGKLPTNAWVNLVTVIDGQTISYYINGAMVGTTNATVDLAATMYSATNSTSGFIGRPFWTGHPFLAGAIDDFRVYNGAMTATEVADLAGDKLATRTGLSQTSFTASTTLGNAPVLPATATGTFSDGIDRPVATNWDPVPPANYQAPGQFVVNGTAGGTAITTTVNVVEPNALMVNLGSNTGPFHGGASGTLYGMYGQDIPSNNLVDGIKLRTVSTKAQDGPQHPGADALEIVKPLVDSSGGDVYIYMTDIYRGFPYQWPGSTPAAKLNDFKAKIAVQVDQVATLEKKYRDHIVFVPFNEPEGNMFGDGQWSYNGVSWLNNPADFFQAWDEVHALIKGKLPDARIAGPNTSVLFNQVKSFLEHTVSAGTVPEVMTWHELSNPDSIRTNVNRYRGWEDEVFAGTSMAETHLPININEYAFNYHTSVPGQMIQWFSALEESKVDGDIAYWNIDGNLSDSAVQANRGNGQWWLLNAYGQMTGHTVSLTPPNPNVSYTLQGVATLDENRKLSNTIFGGAGGNAKVNVTNIPAAIFGNTVHARVQEIPWTGQLGDSAQPRIIRDLELPVNATGGVSLTFDGATLPLLKEESAYQVLITPGANASTAAAATELWRGTYEAETAAYTGSGYSRNGPEGTPADVGKFYTSGSYNVGGFRTGSNGKLAFTVNVPETGTYDLSIFSNSNNTFPGIADRGPTNVFLTVDGQAEQEMDLTLGYKWVVWDHADTTVELTAGTHTITLSANNLAGTKATEGDAIIDKIDLSLANPAAATSVYEGEYATFDGATSDYTQTGVSGSGAASVTTGTSATFWVYAEKDGEATIKVNTLGTGTGTVLVNGTAVAAVSDPLSLQVILRGGINKVTITGDSGTLLVDSISAKPSTGNLNATRYQGEDATFSGTAGAAAYSLADGGEAATGIGGEPNNNNKAIFTVAAAAAGTYAITVRYSNPEQSPASHYNPDPLARHAEVSVNGTAPKRVWFPHSFHQNNFWDLTFNVELTAGANTLNFSSQELPNFDGVTLISDTHPDLLMRSKYAPNIDYIQVAPLTNGTTETPDTSAPTVAVATTPAAATGTNGWFKTAVKVAATFTDPGTAPSGVATRQYRVGSGTWQPYTAAITAPTGTTTYSFRATDNAGNTSAVITRTVKKDSTAPVAKATTTPTKPNGSNGWFKGANSVKVTIIATDTTSGVAVKQYRIGSGAWKTYTKAITVAAGITKVSYRAQDKAGNWSVAKTVTVKRDTKAPTLTITVKAAKARTIIAAKATDALSGVAKTTYRLDGKPARTYTSALTVTKIGKHKVTFTSTDKAGNTTIRSATFTTKK